MAAGSGWVSGAGDVRHPITTGQAAFWHAGEAHTTGTEAELTAVVIEGGGLRKAPAFEGS